MGEALSSKTGIGGEWIAVMSDIFILFLLMLMLTFGALVCKQLITNYVISM